MKFGVREICDVVLKAKATTTIGNKKFYKNEPVIYFDSLKTSSMEGAATTVYAQGGRGNSRLIAWEGERTVTFTMEDALISPAGFMILSGAGLIQAGTGEKSIKVHTTEQTDHIQIATNDQGVVEKVNVFVKNVPYVGDASENWIYVMVLDENGDVATEPYCVGVYAETQKNGDGECAISIVAEKNDLSKFKSNSIVLVDYYVEKTSGAKQIEITPDKFGGNYYLEASTLFKNTAGVDMPAEFIIPNCKIQSNFNFTMASSGDPSTFTFTMDAFPDYTRFDRTKKVLAAIQIIDETDGDDGDKRSATAWNY